jgi:hypothetical protein
VQAPLRGKERTRRGLLLWRLAGRPAWPWPSWVSATPAFLYYDGTAYPTSMDLCVESHLPGCMQKNGRAFSHCTDVVFSRCKQESFQVASVYEPYPGG